MAYRSQNSNSLGADVRSIRKSRGITLIDMSENLGRSVGWMSQVERDISAPSINELREISNILNVPLSIFFGQAETDAAEAGRVVRKDTRRKIGTGSNGLIEELLSPDLTDDFEVIHSVFQPGAVLKEFITRPTQEVGYIISGRLTVWIGDQKFDLNAGDSFRVREEPHKWANPHLEKAVVIWVIAPPVY
ncbi:MAG: cupin domain-containing protein [Proteobacteria bacterium]|nr:cupin domain-containing protein [Pseudomonadota bacterium]